MSDGRLSDRNQLGQKLRPRRLTKEEIALLVNSVEHAINTGIHHEVRVFWQGKRAKHLHVKPITVGETTKLD